MDYEKEIKKIREEEARKKKELERWLKIKKQTIDEMKSTIIDFREQYGFSFNVIDRRKNVKL